MPNPLKRMSLASQAVTALIQLIEERGLKENDVLPPTSELADSLDVSRTVVREAIAELAGLGLVDRRQGRETVITLPNSPQLEQLLHLRFVLQGHDYENLQDFREIVEVGSARLAAAHATDANIEALELRLAAITTAASEDEMHEKDQAFHTELARASGNDMVVLTLDGITPLLFNLRRRAWQGWARSGQGVDPIIKAHAVILDRIRAHDVEGAADAMSAHLAQARHGLQLLPRGTQMDAAHGSAHA